MTVDGLPVPDALALQAQVQRLLRTFGVPDTARRLGLHRETVLAVAAGVPVRAGSLALVRERLRTLERLAV